MKQAIFPYFQKKKKKGEGFEILFCLLSYSTAQDSVHGGDQAASEKKLNYFFSQ